MNITGGLAIALGGIAVCFCGWLFGSLQRTNKRIDELEREMAESRGGKP